MSAMDTEAQKRNTDCVYFLASPLTCKKGNDCEYRHSESARINPRDCWFWLSGTCLNANCPFRHPPLEGRPGASSATTSAPTTGTIATVPAAVTSGKPRVPCYFFAQGYCSKGDKCAFMHGLVPPATMEAAVSQKLSRPASVKAAEPIDKQTLASKGNGSVTSKLSPASLQQIQTTESRTLEGEALLSNSRATQGPALKANHMTTNGMPEGSASSGPARPQGLQGASGNDSSRQVPPIDERLHQVQPVDYSSLQLPPEENGMHENGENRLVEVQPGHEILHEANSEEDGIQNGKESEEWWEESSPGFDVLVDDGIDQLIYAEDVDFLSNHDVAIESGIGHIRGRMMNTDDLADFDYDGAYDQSAYYDSAVQYKLATYDPYEQQLGYDHINSYDHVGHARRQAAVPFKERQIKGMLLRDRRMLDGNMRCGGSTGDLRNHIIKRRRAERSQKIGEDNYRRRHQDGFTSDIPRNRRHHDDHAKQEELLVRHRISAQSGTRSNRRPHGWSESFGKKRSYHDIGPEYERSSADRSSNKQPRNVDEHYKAKVKQKGRGRLVAEGAELSETRGHATLNNKKAESKVEESTFAGPKSLAQIKAEKMKAVGEESSRPREMPEELKSSLSWSQMNLSEESQVLPIRSQISPVPGAVFETARKESFINEEKKNMGKGATHEVLKTSDFEGPKPLSEILKAKRKGDGEFKSEDCRKEQLPKGSFCKSQTETMNAGFMASLKVAADLEEGELLQDRSSVLLPRSYSVHRSETKPMEALQQGSTNTYYRGKSILQNDAHVTPSLLNEKVELQEKIHKGAVEEVGHGSDATNDVEDGVEPEDNVIEDVEFDDDEDDDFAKKLGGFFS